MDLVVVMLWQQPLLGGALYFLPALIAFAWKSPDRWVVFWLVLLTGWTVIGWLIALGFAVSGLTRPHDSARRALPLL